MTDAPERIWTASTGGKCHVGFETPSMNYTNEYIRADLSSPLGAVAVRGEARNLVMELAAISKTFGDMNSVRSLVSAAGAIASLDTPDHAALLAHAMKLPEVAAMVEALTFLHKAMTDNHKVSPPPHRLQIHDGSWHEGPVVDFVHDLLSVMRDYIAYALRKGGQAIEKNHCAS